MGQFSGHREFTCRINSRLSYEWQILVHFCATFPAGTRSTRKKKRRTQRRKYDKECDWVEMNANDKKNERSFSLDALPVCLPLCRTRKIWMALWLINGSPNNELKRRKKMEATERTRNALRKCTQKYDLISAYSVDFVVFIRLHEHAHRHHRRYVRVCVRNCKNIKSKVQKFEWLWQDVKYLFVEMAKTKIANPHKHDDNATQRRNETACVCVW